MVHGLQTHPQGFSGVMGTVMVVVIGLGVVVVVVVVVVGTGVVVVVVVVVGVVNTGVVTGGWQGLLHWHG